MKNLNKSAIALLAIVFSPMIGVVIYLPFAEMANGSLDPLRGLFFGPIVIVPIAGVYLIWNKYRCGSSKRKEK